MLNKWVRQAFQPITFTILLFSTSHCSPREAPQNQEQKKFNVLSTINIVDDMVGVLSCCNIEHSSLMGEGVDPHQYRASAIDLQKLRSADLIVAVGLTLEGRLQETLEGLAKQGKNKIIFLGDSVPSEKLISGDPHIWFDPEIWQELATPLAKELIELSPSNSNQITENKTKWQAEVKALAQDWKQKFSEIPQNKRALITSHDAFQYLGRFFDIKVWAVQGTSTESEASLKHMNFLRELISKEQIPAIFLETSVSPANINRLQKTTNVKIGGTLYSDSLGAKNSPEGSYIGTLQHNLSTIHRALQ